MYDIVLLMIIYLKCILSFKVKPIFNCYGIKKLPTKIVIEHGFIKVRINYKQ